MFIGSADNSGCQYLPIDGIKLSVSLLSAGGGTPARHTFGKILKINGLLFRNDYVRHGSFTLVVELVVVGRVIHHARGLAPKSGGASAVEVEGFHES